MLRAYMDGADGYYEVDVSSGVPAWATDLTECPLRDSPKYEVLRITALQGLLAIKQFGLDTVFVAWAASPERTFEQRAFLDKAQEWDRYDPVLLVAADSFNLTVDQIDAMFAVAVTL